MKLKNWVVKLILISALLDLPISGVLAYNVVQVEHAQAAARCWDRVLDEAVTVHPSTIERARLNREAVHCTKYIP